MQYTTEEDHRFVRFAQDDVIPVLRHVEIFSPGWFPEGHTPEAHLNGEDSSSISPNKLIANTLFKSKDIESFATGMPRIKRLCDKEDVPFRYVKTPHGTNVVFERKDPFAGEVPANSSKFQQIPADSSRFQH